MASSEWGSRSPRCYSRPRLSQFAARYSLLNSLLPIRYSPFATRSLFIRHPEGWAERRWRSDACEAPVSACHDRHADASLDLRRPPRPACVLCAPQASPACDRFPHIGQARRFFANRARPDMRAVRRLAFPATGRSPFGAPRGISGQGPCSPLSGGPSRIVRRPHSTHGSSLPGGAGLASLPGAAANRIRGHHSLAPTYKNASRSAPHERGWKESSIASYWGQQKNSNRSRFSAGRRASREAARQRSHGVKAAPVAKNSTGNEATARSGCSSPSPAGPISRCRRRAGRASRRWRPIAHPC
jgi:hypothetical protein